MTTPREVVEALRSGKYKQGQSFLHKTELGVDEFCCMGVACDLQGVNWTEHHATVALNGEVITWQYDGNLALPGCETKDDWDLFILTPINGVKIKWKTSIDPGGTVLERNRVPGASVFMMDVLAALNDNGHDFNYIADFIERRARKAGFEARAT